MEADWEIEIGGGAPVIEALWPGFVDLRQQPERLAEITEAASFPPLAGLLRALNDASSPVWTAKCDLWETELAEADEAGLSSAAAATLEPTTVACYIDLLPRAGQVFAQWQQAKAFCCACIAHLAQSALPGCHAELIVRQAVAGVAEGFGVTAYLSGAGNDLPAASEALAAALNAFADSILCGEPPTKDASKLQ